MTLARSANGASRPLPRVPPKVFLLNPEPALRLGGRNRSSCPSAVTPLPGRGHILQVVSGH